MKEVFETYCKMDNGRWIFVGWHNMRTDFVFAKRETKKFIYVTYKYLTGNIEEYRYTKGGV